MLTRSGERCIIALEKNRRMEFMVHTLCRLNYFLINFLLLHSCICYSHKIILLYVTNLFTMLNYLFALSIKLFRDVDSFVQNMHFWLFILYNQMFVMFNILFVIHYYLFVMFCFFRENNYLFVLLKYLFPVAKINYLVFKFFLKNIVQI